jgi:hypothetical protein
MNWGGTQQKIHPPTSMYKKPLRDFANVTQQYCEASLR